MGTMASQITSLTIVYSTVYSGVVHMEDVAVMLKIYFSDSLNYLYSSTVVSWALAVKLFWG